MTSGRTGQAGRRRPRWFPLNAFWLVVSLTVLTGNAAAEKVTVQPGTLVGETTLQLGLTHDQYSADDWSSLVDLERRHYARWPKENRPYCVNSVRAAHAARTTREPP